MTITSITASGDFSETNNCGTSVPGGQSCTINVTFTPSQGGVRTGNVIVNPGQETVPLTGTGLGPGITFLPTSLTFTNQAVGTTSLPQTVMLTNTGNATLTISSIGITGTASNEFAQTNSCPKSLVAGANCQIMVTFTPLSVGSFSAAISVSDNLPGSPQLVPLTGSTPGSSVSLAPSSISFPDQYVGTSGLPQTVTLTNTGNTTLTITAVNTTTTDFGELSTCGNSVAPGASCSIGVFFDPTTTGTRSGALTITDSGTGSPQSVPLTGVGQDFSLTSGSQASATVSPGQTANYTVTVTPAGGFSQIVALSCSGGPVGSTCSVSPSSAVLNGATPVSVSVRVTTAGSSASLLRPYNSPLGNRLAMWLTLPGMAGLVFMSSGRRTRKRRWLPYGFVLLCLLSVAITWSACGGSSNAGASGGSYTVSVTGTFTSASVTLTHTTKLTLLVQ